MFPSLAKNFLFMNGKNLAGKSAKGIDKTAGIMLLCLS